MASRSSKSEWVFFAGGVGVLLLFALGTKILLGWIATEKDSGSRQRIEAREELDEENTTRLGTYAWRDKAQGTVQIPIQRAMELTVAELSAQSPRASVVVATENPPDLSPDESYVVDKALNSSIEIGQRIFTWNCALCHQLNGQGVSGQYPPLAGSEWVLAKDWHGDNHIVKIVLHGFTGPMTVNGQHFNNTMAPWGKLLTDAEIASVLTYIRSEWGNDAPPITAEFVEKIRKQTADRKNPWTQKELEEIGKEDVTSPNQQKLK